MEWFHAALQQLFPPEGGRAEIVSPRTRVSSSKRVSRPYIWAHVGKGGGGTVDRIMAEYGVLDLFQTCHPEPCLNRSSTTVPTSILNRWLQPRTGLSPSKYQGMVINVRDPVDRFVSAFNWEKAFCRREHTAELMRSIKKRVLRRKVIESCGGHDGKAHMPEQADIMINNRYGGDANQLAEALCARGDAQSQQQALLDVSTIFHMESLVEWFGGATLLKELVDQRSNFTVSAVPMEQGSDFDALVGNALQYMVENEQGGSFVKRRNVSAEGNFGRHSSIVKSANLKPALSAAGTCCVARYYRKDYALISDLVKVGCHGEHAAQCAEALQAIVARRSAALASHCQALLLPLH